MAQVKMIVKSNPKTKEIHILFSGYTRDVSLDLESAEKFVEAVQERIKSLKGQLIIPAKEFVESVQERIKSLKEK